MTDHPNATPDRPDGGMRRPLPGQHQAPATGASDSGRPGQGDTSTPSGGSRPVDATQEIRPEPARPYGPGDHPNSQEAGHQGTAGQPRQQPAQAPNPQQQAPWGAPAGGYAAMNAHPGGPAAQGPAASAFSTTDQEKAKSRMGLFAAVGATAVLAAALASAGTYGVVKAGDDGTGYTSGNSTVIKADPKDFADAGAVNWSATAAKVNPSVVSISVRSGDNGGQGSGVILDKQGNIVTNNHVVAGGDRGDDAEVQVTLHNNRTYKADIVGTDPSTDLAVIRIKDVPSLTPVEIGDDKKLVVGQPVMAVGNPLGLAGTVTTGIVSAMNRPVTTSGGNSGGSSTSNDTVVTNAIQTSAAINPGNSGGALVDGSGRLIGINSSIASLSSGGGSGQSGNIGIGFAIPMSVVKNISDQLIDKGAAEHALLGISTQPTEVSNGKATLTAAKVSSVSKGSGAEKAGLRENDAIIELDGQPITSANALVAQVRSRTVGSTVKLTIIRDGKQQNVQVTLGAQPAKK
ncbi:trypsin-like peptidase domain-containing protein [Dermacoccus abyssi]